MIKNRFLEFPSDTSNIIIIIISHNISDIGRIVKLSNGITSIPHREYELAKFSSIVTQYPNTESYRYHFNLDEDYHIILSYIYNILLQQIRYNMA